MQRTKRRAGREGDPGQGIEGETLCDGVSGENIWAHSTPGHAASPRHYATLLVLRTWGGGGRGGGRGGRLGGG